MVMLPCPREEDELGETICAMTPYVLAVSKAHDVPTAEAADLLQDIFLVYVVKHETIQVVKPWLAAVARRRCLQYWDSRRRSREVALQDIPEEDLESKANQNAAHSRIDCARALQRLSPRARRLISLRYWSGCDGKEIASRTGLAEGSIDKTSRRVLGQLRRDLDSSYSP